MLKPVQNSNLRGTSSLRGLPVCRGERRRPIAFAAWFSGVVLLLLAGCVSKQAARDQERRAYEAGVQQGQKATEMRMTSVFVHGPVQKQVIPWEEGLTVAKAIVAAVYTSSRDPIAINITRKGRIIPVNPSDLLKGIDPPVEAGDLIDIR